jgi:signal transduction histidine kinase
MIINLFTILPLTCAIFVLFLGTYIFFKNPRSRIHQLLTAFCVCMIIWLFGTFMMFAVRGQYNAAVFWDRFVYFGVVLMPPLMHHFSLEFTGKRGKQRYLLFVNYIIAALFLTVIPRPEFVNGLNVYAWGAHSKAQFLHHVFLGYFFLATSIFFRNIFQYYRATSDRKKRAQARALFLAFGLVMFVGGTAYLYAYGIDTRFPFAYFTGLTFPIILFYSLIRHEFLSSKVLKTEVLIGITDFVLVTLLFLSSSIQEVVLYGIFAVTFTSVGILLVRSVRDEVSQREEVSRLATSLQQANVRLRELDKQKTEFLSIASHQLRTPLSIIKGYIELIQDGAYGKITQKTFGILKNMDESNERLVNLVDEFLNISRIEQGRTKFVFKEEDVSTIIAPIIEELSQRAKEKELRVEWAAPITPVRAVIDSGKIHHVIYNYVDNAIKYTPKGKITVEAHEENNGLVVTVKDTGFGFTEEDTPNFLNKFYRGKNVRGTNVNGTGLGIYVCKQFIEGHLGHVWAKSEGLGKGSEFGFWVPYDAPNREQDKTLTEGQMVVNQYG